MPKSSNKPASNHPRSATPDQSLTPTPRPLCDIIQSIEGRLVVISEQNHFQAATICNEDFQGFTFIEGCLRDRLNAIDTALEFLANRNQCINDSL